MNEEKLMKLSLLGAILFFFISLYLYTSTTPISEINPGLAGKSVCVKGDYFFKKSFKKCLIGYVCDKSSCIDVFSCDSNLNRILTKNYSDLKICGKIKIYSGKIEIIPFKLCY